MPSYINPKTGKRENLPSGLKDVPKGSKTPPPPTAGSRQDPVTGEWKTLRRSKPTVAPKPAAPADESVAPESKQPGETPANWYWRTHRK